MKRLGIFTLVCVVLIAAGLANAETRSERRIHNPKVLVFKEGVTQETILPVAPVSKLDEFTGIAVDATNLWTVTVVNSGTFATTELRGGIATATTGGADDDNVEVASAVIWRADKAVSVEAKISLNDVAGTAFNFGLTDAKTEGADDLPVEFNTPTLTSNASNCAVWFMDADTSARPLAVAVKADVDGTVIGTDTSLTDGAYHIYRIDVYPDGDCSFWIDGDHAGTEETGITTTTPLTVYAGFINRESAANVFRVDYIRAWQNR